MNPFEVRPVDADGWPALRELFGRGGASNGCWCQYWLLGPAYTRRDRTANQDDLAAQARAGEAGLIACDGDRVVGWARFTPRAALGHLTDRFSRYRFSDDDVWALSCFFVARDARGRGVTRALVQHAASWADEHGTAVEGYPVDPATSGATGNRFTGVLPVFLDAGFAEQGRLARDRPVVRYEPRSGRR
ncbi:GNAT family N-acetyltransferase [Desertihabitans aurantiacus]|uniref:GNAT family N-acetyltransferase n=1 Tax=Desertihabitans aurantiacus TaxID=2282477 RepID=UPI00130028E0|nr:GNAT family N-acetyltransferase [Desertihabitans aurantiacus]